jgi:putative transposase
MTTGYQIRNQEGLHFVTFAVVEWVDVFTRKEYAFLLIESLKFCQEKKGLLVYSWCLMSNHLHLIIAVQEGNTLSAVLRDFKRYTAQAIIAAIEKNMQESRRRWMLWIFRSVGQQSTRNEKYQFWQQENHPIELTSNAFKEEKLRYIHRNPVEAGWVAEAEHYAYSSAIDYAGGKGLVPVTFL